MKYKFTCRECGEVSDTLVAPDRKGICVNCKKSDGYATKCNIGVLVDSTVRDLSGEKIYFPKDSTSYFDPALRRTFNSVHEKKAYMDERKLIMDGSSDFSESKRKSIRDTCKDEYKTKKEKENATR